MSLIQDVKDCAEILVGIGKAAERIDAQEREITQLRARVLQLEQSERRLIVVAKFFILRCEDMEDEGPTDESWQSDELMAELNLARKAISKPAPVGGAAP